MEYIFVRNQHNGKTSHHTFGQSQMSGIVIRDDELPYGEKYSVYYTGQETAMIASYEKHKKMLDKRDAIAILDSLL